MYFLVIIGGLILAVALFFQLRNETNAQSRQINSILGNLVLEVYCPTGKVNIEKKPQQTYSIISTSITCGKKDTRRRFQVDFPIETTDPELMGTAVEFFVETDDGSSQLYVRNVEQPVVWIVSAGRTSLNCLAKSEKKIRAEGEQETKDGLVPIFVPEALNDITGGHGYYVDKAALRIGDEIWLTNDTYVVLTYEKGEGK